MLIVSYLSTAPCRGIKFFFNVGSILFLNLNTGTNIYPEPFILKLDIGWVKASGFLEAQFALRCKINAGVKEIYMFIN
jgi:hypothetical protein